MRKYTFLCLLVLIITSRFGTAVLSAEALYSKVLYEKNTLDYSSFRIPSIVQAVDGTILAFAEARKQPSDTGEIDMVVRRSRDRGQSWSGFEVIWHDDGNTCGNPTAVVDEITGRVWLFMTHNLGQDDWFELTQGRSEGIRQIWSCYSDDHGKSWSQPYKHVDISPPLVDQKNYWDTTGPGTGIQLKEGIQASRLIIPANARNIFSDDHGKTWHESPYYYPNGGNEGTVVEISGGAIIRNDRASVINESGLLKEKLYNRVICYSFDQGQSWGPLMMHSELVTPFCQASLISCFNENDDRLLLFANPAALTRNRMTVKVSYNEGLTWPVMKLIHRYDSAYSSLVELDDGTIGLFYENGLGSAYEKMTFARFSLDWLHDQTIFAWDFEEIKKESKVIEDNQGYGLNGYGDAPLVIAAGSGADDKKALRFTSEKGGLRLLKDEDGGLLNFNASENFSIKIVFRTKSHASGGYKERAFLMSKGPTKTRLPGWYVRIQDDDIEFLVQDEDAVCKVNSKKADIHICDGNWHELFLEHDADSKVLNIYIDGNSVGQSKTNFATGSYGNNDDLLVGCLGEGECAFDGDISHVQIWGELKKDLGTGHDKKEGIYLMSAENIAR